MRKFPETPRLLLITGNVMAVAVVIAWFAQASRVGRVLNVSPTRVALAPVSAGAPSSLRRLEPIQDRALFYASRSFYVPPPKPATIEVKPPPPAFRVATVLISADQSAVALLTNPQGKGVVKVRKGDVLEGWTVASVEPKRVTLTYKEDRIELGPKLAAAAMASSASQGSTPQTSVNSPAGTVLPSTPTSYPTSVGTSGRILSVGSTGRPVRVLGAGRNGPDSNPTSDARLFRPPP